MEEQGGGFFAIMVVGPRLPSGTRSVFRFVD